MKDYSSDEVGYFWEWEPILALRIATDSADNHFIDMILVNISPKKKCMLDLNCHHGRSYRNK
jgi:hypothetical protein